MSLIPYSISENMFKSTNSFTLHRTKLTEHIIQKQLFFKAGIISLINGFASVVEVETIHNTD